MTSEVLISYRRDDNPYLAHLLQDRLQNALPDVDIFLDVLSIEPGVDFRKQLERELEKVQVLVAVIGRNWLDATDEFGNRRLDQAHDLVRFEIAKALKRKTVLVVPVLEEQVDMPKADELPDDLKELANKNKITLKNDRYINDQIRQLVDAVRRRRSNPTSVSVVPDDPTKGNVQSGNTFARGRIAVAICPPAARKTHWLRAGSQFRDLSEAPEMVLIPSGTFRMGSPSGESGAKRHEQPQRHVLMEHAFAIGRYPVTVAEWRSYLLEATGRAAKSGPGSADSRLPVVDISWHDASAFAQWLAERTGLPYRLPTEAEWEYAARAGTTTAYWWGNAISAADAHFDMRGREQGAELSASGRPVDRYRANPWGVRGMLGNVAEWVEDDWHDSYAGAPATGSGWVEAAGSDKVVRGGSWRDGADGVRCASRARQSIGEGANFIGFRVARSLLVDV